MQSTSTTTIRGTLERNHSLELLLLDDLADILSEPQDPDTRPWLLAVLDALLRLIPQDINAAQTGGYLEEVLEEYPCWDRQVQELRHQHLALHLQLKELRSEVAQKRVIDGRCGRSLLEWSELLKAHKDDETALLQTAVNLEVGVGD